MDKCKDYIEQAREMLNQNHAELTVKELKDLAKSLKACRDFNYARRLLDIAALKSMSKNENIFILQQLALCINKDVDLPVFDRFTKSIKILERPMLDLKNTVSQETLGITGGVYKRRWEATGTNKYLEMALNYYERGYVQGITSDQGYCAINTAFIYDLLAESESKEKEIIPQAQQIMIADWKQKAVVIRKQVIEKLESLIQADSDQINWWLLVTLAEAKFGMGDFEEARKYLVLGMKEKYKPQIWELETTLRQLARLSTMQAKADATKMVNSAAWKVLTVLLDNPEDIGALYTAFEGKIGLALSGGGFRASFYHIGVLAKLAELDVLRRVEVLSCVSGGSIIGAHYYLEVRKLLEAKTDKEIQASDYIEIVERISREFLLGVQTNLRTRVVADWDSNFKMMFFRDYSRTDKMGELYEKQIFSRVADSGQRYLDKLFICPKNPDGTNNDTFKPKYDNWLRQAKVPILIINATALNTGHNWQFTASWMGESPAAIQQIDGNYRLRRMYYKSTGKKKYRREIKLGAAVAASSGVPGMFDPMVLPHLYEGKKVRLVDGGVHDNQGLCGLLEQDCDVMLVSDASGQMSSVDDPSNSVLGVPMRANDILMERVRNAQYHDMKSRLDSGLLKGLLFIHLKMELHVQEIDWINCEDPQEADWNNQKERLTSYTIRKDIQGHLAAIRTDLDSFHDMEAYSLMCSGYLMTDKFFPQCISVTVKETTKQWQFLLAMQDELKNLALEESKIEILAVSKIQAFKIWQLSKGLKFIARGLKYTGIILLLAVIILALVFWKDISLLSVGQAAIAILLFGLGLVVGKVIMSLLRYRQTLLQFVVKLGIISLGVFIAWVHLNIFDKMYLKKGKV